MYQYDENEKRFLRQRVTRFRDQMLRYLSGRISEDDFRPLRLQNGLYIQRHAPMLRVAIPYGTLSSRQMRALATIARDFDRGYGHFTTRCNIQFNWVRLEEVPDILDALAAVDMHAIQTSGNCIRNITTDHFAGVARDEVLDPRPYCEILRQWSTLSPEYSFLPRKFKVAITGSQVDRAAVRFHDIGLRAVRSAEGEIGFEVFVGGGLGRTPMVGQCVRAFLPHRELLTYVDAIMRTYNRFGRRDKKYKSRIKILVKELGVAVFAREVEHEWMCLRDGPATLSDARIEAVSAHFQAPACDAHAPVPDDAALTRIFDDAFAVWANRNTSAHKALGHSIVTLSLKRTGTPPGDATADQMDRVADLADRFSRGEIRVSHDQNLVLPHVLTRDLHALWSAALDARLATPNVGTATDLVCCPGGDFCNLANARSLPLAEAIQRRFDQDDDLQATGPLSLNISGCVNACGHHHVGHLGVLGVDKNGQEFFQVTLGGHPDDEPAIGKIMGPALPADQVPVAIERVIKVYREHRAPEEAFIHTVERLGHEPFKAAVYGGRDGKHSHA